MSKNFLFLKTPKNAFDKLVSEMTDTMTRVTLTNTTTISPSASSSSLSSHIVNDLTLAQSSSSTISVSSTLPLRSTSTTTKDKISKPRKIHTYDDYLVYILKWPVSLIDELGLNIFILIIIK